MQHFLSLAHFISWKTISWLFSLLSQHSFKQLFKQFLSSTHQAGEISNDIHFQMNQIQHIYLDSSINVNLQILLRYAYTPEQVRNKPGREVVTFLLVCNLAMWAINTLETNRADSHPIQVRKRKFTLFGFSFFIAQEYLWFNYNLIFLKVDFYGGTWAWPIITHISMPLAIFYRFHSTVCLCEVWKRSFKYKNFVS